MLSNALVTKVEVAYLLVGSLLILTSLELQIVSFIIAKDGRYCIF